MNTYPTDRQADEMAADTQLPFFCYGTLRPGHGNTWAWDGRGTARYDGTARVLGHRLVSNGAFPYMIPAVTDQAVGTLIFPYADQYQHVMDNMDMLEGVPVHYTRERVAVLCDDPVDGAAIFTAWTYIPRHPDTYADLAEVPGNDWANHVPRRWHPSRGQR